MKKENDLLKVYMGFMICLIITGCNKLSMEIPSTEKIEGTQSQQVKQVDAWVTYWDVDDIGEELMYWKDQMKGIQYFAAYFNKEGELFIPDQVTKVKAYVEVHFKEEAWPSYLSIVNDLELEGGRSSLKDTKLLAQLFESEEQIEKHAQDVIRLAREGGFDGIEMDYEGIRSDHSLWHQYIVFLNRLYEEALAYEMPVRVLLEPGAPLEVLKLPEGPEYVMMCYNLYGYGTTPGPKADKAFLLKLVEKMKQVPGNIAYALATGGFDFREDGLVKALNTQEAIQLLEIQNQVAARDEESGAMMFTYQDEMGLQHEIWYADEETLNYWKSVLKEAGEEHISIWRLGGTFIE